LEEHEAFMNYDKLLNEIGNKNQQMKNMIQDMDDNFVEIYNDLGMMYKHVVNKDDKENEHENENENEKKNNDNNVGNSSSSSNNNK
jgi:hypothetical protein